MRGCARRLPTFERAWCKEARIPEDMELAPCQDRLVGSTEMSFLPAHSQLPFLDCRPLCHGDNVAVRALCAECFPISYPNSWFDYITSNKVYSQGAFTQHGTLVGMLVAEFQPLAQLEGEAGALLECATTDTTVVYVISLGVLSHYRGKGLGTMLVTSLLEHVACHPTTKLVYLHVLADNAPAIEFYRRLGFQECLRIPNYYLVTTGKKDGLLYCSYVNGGLRFTGRITSYFKRYIIESWLCRTLLQLCNRLYELIKSASYPRRLTF